MASANAVQNTAMHHDTRWLWVCLCSFRNAETGVAFPSLGLLMRITGLGRMRIRNAMKELTKAGRMTMTQTRNGGRFEGYNFVVKPMFLTEKPLDQQLPPEVNTGAPVTVGGYGATGGVGLTTPSGLHPTETTPSNKCPAEPDEEDFAESLKQQAIRISRDLNLPEWQCVAEAERLMANPEIKRPRAALEGLLRKIAEDRKSAPSKTPKRSGATFSPKPPIAAAPLSPEPPDDCPF